MKISGHIVRSSAVAKHLKRRRAPHDLKSLIKIMKISSFLAVSCLWLRTGLPLILAFPLLLVSAPVSTLSVSDARFTFNANEDFDTPATGGWTFTGSLNPGRYAHTATLLPNGKVLVAFGGGTSDLLSGAKLYDPASGNWSATGSLNHRTGWSHGDATAQRQGAGGGGSRNGSGSCGYTTRPPGVGVPPAASMLHGLVTRRRCCPTARCWWRGSRERFRRSPERGAVRPYERDLDFHRQPQHRARGTHGDVAAQRHGAGGRGMKMSSARSRARSCTTRPPGAGLRHGSLNTARSEHTATLLPNGKVLVAGGIRSLLTSAELYDPASGTWTFTGSLNTAREQHTATLLPNGKVLVAGGFRTAAVSRARNCTIRPAGPGVQPAASTQHATIHTATLLQNGKVLVAGGLGESRER